MRYSTLVVYLLVALSIFVTKAKSQSCPSGLSFGSMCMQSCNTANCNLQCSGFSAMCMQECQDFGVCHVLNCSSSGLCMQTCAKTCDNLKCQSENCTQMCNGNCKQLTCDAKRCTQTCQNGCTMECTDKAESCDQICGKGNCTFICKVKDVEQCNQKCMGGGCTYSGPPRNKTTCDKPIVVPDLCMQLGCPYKDCHMECNNKAITQKYCQQYCSPPDVVCPQSMACDTEECNQMCAGDCKKAECSSTGFCVQQCSGLCKTSHCTSKICTQSCSDGSCDTLECTGGTERCAQFCNGTTCKNVISKASKEEIQFCIGGNCESLKCSSQNCTQVSL